MILRLRRMMRFSQQWVFKNHDSYSFMRVGIFLSIFMLINVVVYGNIIIIQQIIYLKGLIDMARNLKNGRYINVNINMDVFDILEQHCVESGQTKTMAIERAIRACYGSNRVVTDEDITKAQLDSKKA